MYKYFLLMLLSVMALNAQGDRYTYLYSCSQEFSYCDVNDDGNTDVLDLVLIIEFITGDQDFNEEQQAVADLNSDGAVNVLDIVLLVNSILNPQGYDISGDHSIAVRFPQSPGYLDEEFYIQLVSFKLRHSPNAGIVRVDLHEDNENSPGELIWSHSVTLGGETEREYYVYIIGECLGMEVGAYYWMSLHADDDETEAVWEYSDGAYYTISESNDDGQNWTTGEYGRGGLGHVRAEAVYHFEQADPIVMPEFLLEDINPNSATYGEMVGPSVFAGNVSCYYFSSVH